jgi:hypothetical protein
MKIRKSRTNIFIALAPDLRELIVQCNAAKIHYFWKVETKFLNEMVELERTVGTEFVRL